MTLPGGRFIDCLRIFLALVPVLMPPVPSAGIARSQSLWIVVTVRVAWEFLNAGIRLTPEVLSEAREHVLRSIPDDCTDPDRVEVLARAFAGEYIRRVRHQDYTRIPELEDIEVAVPRSWASRLEQSVSQIEEAVYRLHYGDGLSLEDINSRYEALDMTRLIGAREGMRELARSYAKQDGHVSMDWKDVRLDGLLRRVASRPKGSCPEPRALLRTAGVRHADQCPACSRAVRLIRGGIIRVEDLDPDLESLPDMERQEGIVVLLLHPDARRYRKRVIKALGGVALSAGTDCWLVPENDFPRIQPALYALCEEASPHRHHLRGTRLRGPARWSRGVLLGPLPVDAIELARCRPWADMGNICRLPKALPPPPKATLWWAAAALAGLAVLGTARWVFQPEPVPLPTPVQAVFSPLDAGWQVRFDTPDLAVVDVVILDQGVVHHYRDGIQAGKGFWATGEGDYELFLPGKQVLLISSPAGVETLPELMVAANDHRDPIEELAEELSDRYADVALQMSWRADEGRPDWAIP